MSSSLKTVKTKFKPYKEPLKIIHLKDKEIRISGPFYKYSSPYGKVHHSLDRDEWFVSIILPKEKQVTEFQKLFGSTSLGIIVRYHSNRKRFIISQLYPSVSFNSLKKAINFLIENEGKLVFCS